MSEPMTTAPPPLLANGRPAPAERMTYEQFLEWLDDETHAEWVDGWVVPMSPIGGLHDQLVAFLRALMRLFLEAHPVGQDRGDPFQMKTGPDLPGRAPDLIFIASENLSRLHKTFLEGPADIAVEVANVLRLFADIEGVAGIELHRVGEFVGLDAGFELGVVLALAGVAFV